MIDPNDVYNFMHNFAKDPVSFVQNPEKLPVGMKIEVDNLKGIFGKSKIYKVSWEKRKIIEIKLFSHHRIRRLLRRSCKESNVVRHNLVAYVNSGE